MIFKATSLLVSVLLFQLGIVTSQIPIPTASPTKDLLATPAPQPDFGPTNPPTISSQPTRVPTTATIRPTPAPQTLSPGASPVESPVTSPFASPVASPTNLPTFGPDADRTDFSAVIELEFELEDESVDDVATTVDLLPLVYNLLVNEYDDPFERRMEDAKILSIDPISGSSIIVRNRQLMGFNIRVRVNAGGKCNGCPINSRFTNQVSGRRRTQLQQGLPTEDELKEAYSEKITTTDTGNVLDVETLEEIPPAPTIPPRTKKSKKGSSSKTTSPATNRSSPSTNKSTKSGYTGGSGKGGGKGGSADKKEVDIDISVDKKGSSGGKKATASSGAGSTGTTSETVKGGESVGTPDKNSKRGGN